MKLKEWLDDLNAQVEKRPELLECVIVTAIDDEGNGYNSVNFTAAPGNYDEYEFTPEGQMDEISEEAEVNSICLN